jgi:hypothetical protein
VLPNLVVIGAMKCGTSALHFCIDLHPDASMSTPKELNYFFDEPQPTDSVSIAGERELQMVHMREGNWRRGPDWYAEHFDPKAKVRGESSPAYTAPWHPKVAERMATLIPQAKLIFLVRDPIARMISQYRHHLALGREWRDLDEALTIPNGVYVERSRYWARLEPFARRFPADAILVISQERLLAQRRATLDRVFDFLGLERHWDPRMERSWNRGQTVGWRRRTVERIRRLPGMGFTYRLPREVKWVLGPLVSARGENTPGLELSSTSRARLADDLEGDVAQLRAWTGDPFPEWSI